MRLALGRGSWPLLGVAAGIGLETKYTLAVVLVLLIATFLVWRRDVLRSWGFPVAVAIAGVLLVPNLVWEAGHGWASVHWFLDPPASASDESRPQFIVNVMLLAAVAIPVAVAGVMSLIRDRAVRPLGWTVVGTVVAYFVLGGKSYYALPVMLFALAAGSLPLDRRLRRAAPAPRRRFAAVGLLFLPLALPVLPLPTADQHGVVEGAQRLSVRGGLARICATGGAGLGGSERHRGRNYGEAGALRVLGHQLPPVASADVTMRYWRPQVSGRSALVVGYSRRAADFCDGYRLVARISGANDSDEAGEPIARCTLRGTLARCGRRSSRRRGSALG